MKFTLFNSTDSQVVIELFTRVFSIAEGESEGHSIGALVTNLINTTQPQDLIGCVAIVNESIIGCIFFSRFNVPNNGKTFILSPVAIATESQGTGIGQQLIHFGIEHLRSLNTDLLFTYGDPAFYAKTGFEPISESVIAAPYPLSQPIGWLAQSLNGKPINTATGPTACVEALSDPSYW